MENKKSFSSALDELGKEAFNAAKKVLMEKFNGEFILPETITLNIDTCTTAKTLHELEAKKVVLDNNRLVILADLDPDLEKYILNDKDAYFDPYEAWFEGGEWYVEWEGLFEVIDCLVNFSE